MADREGIDVIRIKDVWRARKDRRAKVNQQLAEADASCPGRLDRWDTEPWTDEQSDRLLRLLEEDWDAPQ